MHLGTPFSRDSCYSDDKLLMTGWFAQLAIQWPQESQ